MTPAKTIYTLEEVKAREIEKTKFYLESYIPVSGIVMLYGKFGTYKTPITFAMAKALAAGESLWGLQVMQASPVLYLEADSPEEVILERFKAIAEEGPAIELDVAFQFPGVNVVAAGRGIGSPIDKMFYHELFQAHKERDYKVVFVDALRGIHTLDDKESDAPHQVYSALTGLFPGATIVVIHHDRKSSAEETEDMRTESFSGSQAWINHATVGIKVAHHNRERGEISLHHTKSQASELRENLLLRVEDGFKVSALHQHTLQVVKEVLKAFNNKSVAEQDELIAKELRCSTRTATRRRLEYLAAEAHAKVKNTVAWQEVTEKKELN